MYVGMYYVELCYLIACNDILLHEMYINITKVLSSGHFKIFYLGYFQKNIRIFITFNSLFFGFGSGRLKNMQCSNLG